MNGVAQIEGVVAHGEVMLQPERWQHHSVAYGERQSQFVDFLFNLRLDVHRRFHVHHVGHRGARRHRGRRVTGDRGVRVVHLIQLVLKH